MRYRKRISLGGGSHLNISKSGLSLTGGVKGLSMTFGKGGTYLNYGIPGSGIYNRTKIGSSKSTRSNSHARESTAYSPFEEIGETTHVKLLLTYNDDGSIIFKDSDGNEITDPAFIKMIKSTPEYAEELKRMTSDRVNEYDEKMDGVINIQRLTPKVYSTKEWAEKIEQMEPMEYKGKAFDIPAPRMADVISELRAEAENTIQVKSKRKKEKLCERYVLDTKNIEFDNRTKKWEKEKNAFLEREAEQKKLFDEKEKIAFIQRKEQFRKLVNGNEIVVEKAIDEWLSGIKFDFEFNLEYEQIKDILFVDLDLPEIEDMPENKVQVMANGTAKYKPKAKKEVKEDYSKCVFGLAVYFAGNLFNRALNAKNIVLSGYTQRRNSKGDIVDDYIYSVIFERDAFKTIDCQNDDPRSNCMRFKNRCLQNADMSFKAIVPYSKDDVVEE